MIELILLCGPSGSGKSTWAENFIKEHNDFVVISTDQIREELWGDASNQHRGDLVFKTAYYRIEQLLYNGRSVIFDATNLRKSDRRKIIRRYSYLNPIFSCHCFMTDFDECCARQEKRERKVPIEVISRQFNNFVIPDYNEGWHRLRFHKNFNDLEY